MPYYLRKKVKFIDNRWRYIYVEGGKFDTIPDKVFKDRRIIKFLKIWGNGKYEFIRTDKGRNVEKKITVKKLNFRAMADSNGKPILSPPIPPPRSPPKQTTPKPQSKPSPSPPPQQTRPKPPPKQHHIQATPKPSPTQQPKQTRSTPQPQQQPRQTTYEPPPTAPPEQTSPAQTVPEPSPKSSPTQQPIEKTSITPQILPEMITPDQKEKKRKLRTNRCYVCKISSKWFPREGTSYCPVCKTEYETSCGCPDCGAIIAPEANRCPRCITALGEEDEGEKFLKCFKCNIKLEWNDVLGVYFCMQCLYGYVNRRACPACSSEIDLTTTECYNCQKKLEIGEGEYLYPKCIDHDIEMDYNDDAGLSCPECTEDQDLDEEEEEEFKCPECGAVLPGGLAECPKCGTEFEDEGVNYL